MQDNTNKTTTGVAAATKTTAEIEHPLGKMIKVKVFALSPTEKKSQIFASINQYTFELQQNTAVELPEAIVKFLSSSTKIVHTLDEKGDPIAKDEPLYAVTIL